MNYYLEERLAKDGSYWFRTSREGEWVLHPEAWMPPAAVRAAINEKGSEHVH